MLFFPFYEEARKAIPDEKEWRVCQDTEGDTAFMDAMQECLENLSPTELEQLISRDQDPYINPIAGIGRNDPCPCGSGKKYKKCCGKDI